MGSRSVDDGRVRLTSSIHVKEGASIGRRRGFELRCEMLTKGQGRTEARCGGDPLDGQVGGLQELLRSRQALASQPLDNRRASSLSEAAGEGPPAHVRDIGQDVQ